MVGSGLMLLFGMLFMWMVIGLPILLIVAAVTGVWGLSGHRKESVVFSQEYGRPVTLAASITSFCSHCNQGLQAD